MQEEDPTAIEPDEKDEKPLEGGDVAEPSPPQEAELPKEESDVPPGPRPAAAQQEAEQDSQLQTEQPDQPHPPVSESD